MASNDFTSPLPTEPTTLQAKEYLEFLRMIEQPLPIGTRAYLVARNDDGTRRVTPVDNGASVVSLREDLISHLKDGFFDDAFYDQLHEHCQSRRKQLPNERIEVALNATWETEQLCNIALASVGDEVVVLGLRGVIARIKTLNSAIMSALDEKDLATGDIYHEVHGVPMKAA